MRSTTWCARTGDPVTAGISPDRLAECARRLGHTFGDLDLVRQALVHRSWQSEHGEPGNNERLEFLGDAVLGWVVADMAFHRFSDEAEGRLTDLRRAVVNMNALADLARRLGIGEFLLLGRGEDAAGGRDKNSILADALEAMIGAVYLDAGPDAARSLVRAWFTDEIESAIPNLEAFDMKTRLQELCARLELDSPSYDTTGEGPDHERVFTAVAVVRGRRRGTGTGRTKKAAEQEAATRAWDSLVGEFGDPFESPRTDTD